MLPPVRCQEIIASFPERSFLHSHDRKHNRRYFNISPQQQIILYYPFFSMINSSLFSLYCFRTLVTHQRNICYCMVLDNTRIVTLSIAVQVSNRSSEALYHVGDQILFHRSTSLEADGWESISFPRWYSA